METFEISFKRLVTNDYEVVLVTSHTKVIRAINKESAKALFKVHANDMHRMTGDIFRIESVYKK